MNVENEESSAESANLQRVVIRLEELRPHMTIVWAFNRFHVADAMAKMLGGKRASYDSAASRILAKARKDGTLKPARKDYDRYYFFADV
jgi:ribonuclease HII